MIRRIISWRRVEGERGKKLCDECEIEATMRINFILGKFGLTVFFGTSGGSQSIVQKKNDIGMDITLQRYPSI